MKLRTILLILSLLTFLSAWTRGNIVLRPTDSTYLHTVLKPLIRGGHSKPGSPGTVAGSAPDFFHALAFSLMMMAFLPSRKSRAITCLAWFCIETLFELGQKYGSQLFGYLPSWMEQVPTMGSLQRFFITGRFDLFDIAAFGCGCLTAFFIGELTAQKGERHAGEETGFKGGRCS